MIIVRVELLSAITGKTTELARMEIINDGTSVDAIHGDYTVRTLRGRNTKALDRRLITRNGMVINYARLRLHVWHLVAKALSALAYG